MNLLTTNAEIKTTSITQSANELLGKKEQNLYYLIIKTAKGQLTINVGQKTHDEVKKLTEITTNIQFEKPEENTKIEKMPEETLQKSKK